MNTPKAKCCEKAGRSIFWLPRDRKHGPHNPGWAIINGKDCGGDFGCDNKYANIKFCPFCGKKLPSTKELLAEGYVQPMTTEPKEVFTNP